MVGMVIVIVVCGLVVLAVVAGAAWWARRSFDTAVDRVTERQVADRDAVLTAALQQVDVLNRSQMDAATRQVQAEVAARHQVIDSSLDEVRSEIRIELERLGELVAKMGETSAQRFGQVDASLRAHAEVAARARRLDRQRCARRWPTRRPAASGASAWPRTCCAWPASSSTSTTTSRRQRSTAARGAPRLHVPAAQGPRPLHGRQVPAGGVPALPRGRHRRRARGRTCSASCATCGRGSRSWPSATTRGGATEPSVDYVLLFLPNEQLTGFIHEHDPALLDDALGQQVVLCSPLTLFAFLGVIRQAFDNFMVEQTSDEILAAARRVQPAVAQATSSVDREGGPAPGSACSAEFDQLIGTRERQLERPLRQLEALPPAASDPRRPRVHRRAARRTARRAGTAGHRPRLAHRRRVATGPPTAQDFARHVPAAARLRGRGRRRGHRRSRGTYTVGELAEAINRRIRGGSSDGLWVRGEIQGWSDRGPHAYFTLADDAVDAPTPGGHRRGSSSPQPASACARCCRAHRLRLADGMKVRIFGYLDFYAPGGQIRLKMTGIDPRFTLGDLAQQRDQVMRRLVAERPARRQPDGTPLGRAPLRVGVVTSVGTAAWHDFHHELAAQWARLPAVGVRRPGAGRARRRHGRRAPSPRWPPAATSTPSWSSAGAAPGTSWRCSTPKPIARAIAAAPVPVLTGLGHEVDRSVADEVAHTSYKTPTACAQALVGMTATYLAEAERAYDRVLATARRRHRASRRRARRPRSPHRPAHPGRRRSCRGRSRPTAWPAAHLRPAGARRRRLAGRARRSANPGAAAAGAHRREPAPRVAARPRPAPSTRW